MFHNASVRSPRCQTSRGPTAAIVIHAPESSKAISRVFMLLPPPPLMPNCLYLLSNRLWSHSCSQMASLCFQQAWLDPSPFQKQPLTYSDWRSVRFKSSPPFSDGEQHQIPAAPWNYRIALQGCRRKTGSLPIWKGVVAFDRQLLSLSRKLLDPSLKGNAHGNDGITGVCWTLCAWLWRTFEFCTLGTREHTE